MNKSIILGVIKLKILNDGSSFHKWDRPWKGWAPLTAKDNSMHPLWASKLKKDKSQIQLNYIEKYIKTFQTKR